MRRSIAFYLTASLFGEVSRANRTSGKLMVKVGEDRNAEATDTPK
jgi:hypothetical protein